jgi:hypothetical protein
VHLFLLEHEDYERAFTKAIPAFVDL